MAEAGGRRGGVGARLAVALGLPVAFLAASGPPLDTGPPAAVEDSVVKIFVRSSPPDLISPWQKAGMRKQIGSGVVVSGGRILTNAHVVADAVTIEVVRTGSGDRYLADVEFEGPDCDLALLRVRDPEFLDGLRPMEIGRLPPVRTQVQAYGFPIGGETISASSGIISRVEVAPYAHSREELLVAQIDAPINPGNSGGPVVSEGAIVGIAMQAMQSAQGIGYMVPAPVVRHFLDDVADGRYDGFPRLGVLLQPLESESLRASLLMTRRQSGALVIALDYGGPAYGRLAPGDVILSIEGLPVANDVTVPWPGVGRIHATHVFREKQIGDSVRLELLRNGAVHQVVVELRSHSPLVPGRRPQRDPQYLLFGGLVFQPLTGDYLSVFRTVPAHLAHYALDLNVITEDRRQVILIQKVLPHPVNRGYQDWEDCIVRTVDGVVPRDMEHMARILDSADGPWLRLVTEGGLQLTLDPRAARAAGPEILAKFGIPRDRSPDLAAPAVEQARGPD